MLVISSDIDTIAVSRTFDGIETAAHRVITQAGGMASVIDETCPEKVVSINGYPGIRRSS